MTGSGQETSINQEKSLPNMSILLGSQIKLSHLGILSQGYLKELIMLYQVPRKES